MAYLDLGYFGQDKKIEWETKKIFFPWRLTRRSLLNKATNNTHYLSLNRYIQIFPNRWHGIIIWTLMVSEICCLSCLNSWWNIIDPVRKSHAVMRMKVKRNKGICPEFSRNALDGCRDDHDELTLVYPVRNLPQCQLQELPCLSLVLLCLEFIIGLIESDCPSLFLPNPDPLLRKIFKSFSDIGVIFGLIREKGPPPWEVKNHL